MELPVYVLITFTLFNEPSYHFAFFILLTTDSKKLTRRYETIYRYILVWTLEILASVLL